MTTEPVHPMVMRAARVLNRRAAQCCNTNEEDSWRVYGPDFIADAHAALTACGALECLEALQTYAAVAGNTGYSVNRDTARELHTLGVAAINKVYGSAPE
jgi:hypothetical protein